MSSPETQAWIRLLLTRGYRLDQLIVDEKTGHVTCTADDLPAAAALVQNPHAIDLLQPEILQNLRQLLINGRLAHHLWASQTGSLIYDREEVTSDCEAVAFGRYDEKRF